MVSEYRWSLKVAVYSFSRVKICMAAYGKCIDSFFYGQPSGANCSFTKLYEARGGAVREVLCKEPVLELRAKV